MGHRVSTHLTPQEESNIAEAPATNNNRRRNSMELCQNKKRAATITFATILLCSAASNNHFTIAATSHAGFASCPRTHPTISSSSVRASSAQCPEVESSTSPMSLLSFQFREKVEEGPSTTTATDHTSLESQSSTGKYVTRQGIPMSPVIIRQPDLTRKSSALHTSDPSFAALYDAEETTIVGGRSRRNSSISSNRLKTIHYNDALLNRILDGRKSSSPRWRKRTRRAAASLGFNVKKPKRNRRVENSIRMTPTPILTKFSGGALPPSPVGLYSLRRPVPPLYSTSSNADTKNEKKIKQKKQKKPLFERFRKRKRRRQLTNEQYQNAKLEWATRYTSISTLRSTFGTNRNRLWGDFDPSTTRKLYNTLLPRAILGLYEMGLWSPRDLAPLAYEARLAAKKYARERCVIHGRVVAMLYDGFRSWRDWGTWSVEGMSWEQVWYKYEIQVLDEMGDDVTEEEVTGQICLRILERSCITNERINRLLLGQEDMKNAKEETTKKNGKRRNADRYLEMIASKLEMDMQELMDMNNATSSPQWMPLWPSKLQYRE